MNAVNTVNGVIISCVEGNYLVSVPGNPAIIIPESVVNKFAEYFKSNIDLYRLILFNSYMKSAHGTDNEQFVDLFVRSILMSDLFDSMGNNIEKTNGFHPTKLKGHTLQRGT